MKNDRSGNCENQRSRLTKRLIDEAFLDLLREMDFGQITVQAICEKAEINRSTFYRHYDNQYQLLDVLEKGLIDELEQHGDVLSLVGKDSGLALETMTDFFECIQSRMDLYHTLTTKVHPNIFEKSHILRTEDTMRTLEADGRSFKTQYLASFIVTGGQKIVSDWISKGATRESPEDMARLMIGILKKVKAGY